MASCGLWLTERGIVAAVVDDDGAALGPALVDERSAEAAWDVLTRVEAHHGLDCDFVVTDEALAAEPDLSRVATGRGSRVLVVSAATVGGLRGLVGARPTSRRLALLLARLPLCSILRDRLMPMRVQLELF